MPLPTLALPLRRATGCDAGDLDAARAAWLAATQKTRATSKSWKNFSSRDKRRLVHQVAQRAQTDKHDYFTPYLQADVDDVLAQHRWSVEHVVPRSRCQVAEGDPWNFVEADRRENSVRSSLPLKLWPDEALMHDSCLTSIVDAGLFSDPLAAAKWIRDWWATSTAWPEGHPANSPLQQTRSPLPPMPIP